MSSRMYGVYMEHTYGVYMKYFSYYIYRHMYVHVCKYLDTYTHTYIHTYTTYHYIALHCITLTKPTTRTRLSSWLMSGSQISKQVSMIRSKELAMQEISASILTHLLVGSPSKKLAESAGV